MIIMNLEVDNLSLFNNFKINLSYPKKIVGSTIPEEHLQNHPNFRYKKAIILMGANATGKTSLGVVLMSIFNFINKKDYRLLVSRIRNPRNPASFQIDFVHEDILYRVSTTIKRKDNRSVSYSTNDFDAQVSTVKILSGDNYETALNRLLSHECEHSSNYIDEFEKIPRFTWLFEYPFDDPQSARSVDPFDRKVYRVFLEKVLRALDPRILEVAQVKENETTYVIRHEDFNLIMDNGKLVDPSLLSSGTRDGISIANMIATMKLHVCQFYYCDEQFSHVHSEMEKAFLSLLIDILGPNEQLFFTTHNPEILSLDLPKHTFAFLVRDSFSDHRISCTFASEYLKKNSDSLRIAVENDLFSATPEVDTIYDIADM